METLREVISDETKRVLELNNLEMGISDRFMIIKYVIEELNRVGITKFFGLSKELVSIRESISNGIGKYYSLSIIRYIPE